MKLIETIALDKDGFELYRNDSFETIKEAKQWIKETLMEQSYWNRLAENETFALEVYTIQLTVNGACHSDWFPKFT